MRNLLRNIGGVIARISDEHPGRILLIVSIVTIVAIGLASGLDIKTNIQDMLPEHSPAVQSYIEVTERFGEANTIIVLEGERDRMIEAAEALIPRLEALELIYNVQGTIPMDYFIDHALMLVDENDLDRTLDRLTDPSLVGFLRGINDDFEREYTDSEENMREDEVEIAQSMHGMQRSLEILAARLSGEEYATIEEAADAMVVGDPWMLSLDRGMMLIICTPLHSIMEFNYLLDMVVQVQEVLEEVRPEFPEVEIGLSGNGPLQKDELDSMTASTAILMIIAMALIYLLLARNFGGWVLPLLALTPLIVGIIWAAAALEIVYGSLNMFTIMFSIILLGLGIDFAIHLITRFYEEMSNGHSVRESLIYTITGTGVAVLAGGLTTSAAFLALLVGETKGISELGFTCGAGLFLTLVAVFLILPPLLVLRSRRMEKKGRTVTVPGAREGWPLIGKIAELSWRRWGLFLALFTLVMGASLWAGMKNEYELDWLNLEPKGLENVRLQREIPERFGTMTEGGWIIVDSIEEARDMKDRLKGLSMVGEVSTISDYLPTDDRYEAYAPLLTAFRQRIENTRAPVQRGGWDGSALALEIERLWDNLDLMSNLAFTGGLDRAVKSLDRMTGYDNETDTTNENAVLPTLTRLLDAGVDRQTGTQIEQAWFNRMRENLIRMSGTQRMGIEDLPEVLRKSLLPRDGSKQYLVNITAKDYLWHQTTLERFSSQMEQVDPGISGTAQLTLDFLKESGRDGKNGMIVAAIIILILLLITFRGPMGLLAMLPLIGGSLMMLGVMYIFGMKYNYMNFMAIPVILGIGIDDGVHALHRFQEDTSEGPMRVFNSYRFVGRAIMLTTLTTMIGFGSLGFIPHVAMASFGIVLMFGVGCCFITTVVFLPAVMRLFGGKNFKTHAVKATALLSLLAVLVLPAAGSAQDTGAEWLERIAGTETIEHSYALMRQTITTSTGAERSFMIRSWSAQEGDVGLMAYTEPARVAGDRILQLNGGDDIWYYMKRRDTIRHFAGHTRKQSAMGSDFSYEDMASGDFSEDYTAEVLGYEELDGVQMVKLKCTPTPSGPSYEYIHIWAGVDDALSRKIEYYDEGTHLKTLFLTEFTEIEGRMVALRFEMVSHQKDSRTLMETLEMTFTREPDPSLFTQAALTRPLPPR